MLFARSTSAALALAAFACASGPRPAPDSGPESRDVPPLPHVDKGAEDGETVLRESFIKPKSDDPKCLKKAVSHVGYGTHGNVLLAVAVGVDGNVLRVKVVKPESAPSWYQERVEREVKQCPFQPGIGPSGTPVKMWVLLPGRYVY